MYPMIKQMADEAIALQNKDRMDAVLREISAICGVPSAELEPVVGESGEPVHVSYGADKAFESEAEMIADIQGSPSPVFPLAKPAKKGRAK